MTAKPSLIASFLKYNVTAIAATAADFLVLILFTELFKFWYLIAGTLGAISGGITAFILSRNWTFDGKEANIFKQAVKYVIVWLTSILLNITGLYILVNHFGYQYIISKIIIAIVVGIGFNYYMQKHFIFK